MWLISFGYAGLFAGSFISATLLPFPSEGLLIGAYHLNFSVWLSLLIATLGNFFGGLTNYAIGYRGRTEKIEKKFNLTPTRLALWEKRLANWGIFLGLFSWVPFLGDPMVAALGFFKVRFWPLAAMMLVGKFLRYLILTLLYLKLVG